MTREMKDGRFVRQPNRFTDRIGTDEFPAESGRYQLYASLACPWAHRSLIVRRLLGLEDAIGVTIVDPIRDERGWRATHAGVGVRAIPAARRAGPVPGRAAHRDRRAE
jgi:putative glutathione S-transferase